jgi:hypothetical protein
MWITSYWRKKHWQCIKHNYLKTPFFREYESFFETLYLSGTENSLSKINYRFLRAVSEILNIKTEFKWSDEFELEGDKTEKLVNICKNLNATQYISGPSARNYLNETLFEENGIEVVWMDFTGYPEYPQQFGPFDHAVSILDLLFNVGPAAPSFMKSFTS